MNPSSTLQYLKKPFFWKLGYLKINKKAKIQAGVGGVDDTEASVGTCVPLSDEAIDEPLSLTAFRGELDSAVSQYISQVKDLGYKEEGARDHKLLAVKFQLDPDDIKPKSEEEIEEAKPRIKVISREDKSEQTELEVELLSLDNPLYLTLSECSSGLVLHTEEDLPLHHHYENGHIGREDEHIYENVENSTGEEKEGDKEEHLYDTLPRRKPDLPPKPDFLSQLAARQSEPVKRAWNPFVSLSVDTGDPTPPLSTASSLSSPDSNLSSEHSEESKSTDTTITSPFLTTSSRETLEQTLILDGSETSDLGSSGGEYDVGSVEDWPLPPTPPPGEEEVVTVQDDPLPPPPPELALQQLEEEVFREEQEERKLALQKETELKEHDHSSKALELDKTQQIEAVNTNLTSIEEKLKKPVSKTPTESKKEPKIILVDDDESEEFDTPAIRHSVIIELKDSCPVVPQSIKPSDIRRKESLKRSESTKHTSVLRRTNSYNKVNRRESLCDVFPSIKSEFKKSENGESVSVGVISPKEEAPSIYFFDASEDNTDQVIKISDDGSWETKSTNMDSQSACQSNREDIDPFTGNAIMAPPLSPSIAIAAPPTQFQSDDGMDGVYSANIVSIHSGPSSLADFTSLADFAPPETPTFLSAPETILEEPQLQDPDVDEPTPICPSEEMDVKSPTHKNLGAAIMAGYEEELQKKKSTMNLPEHSLLEFGDTVRDLEEQRRSVIKQMTVKAKRKDTWIKTFNMHDQGKENIPVAPSRSRRKNSPVRPQTVTKSAASSQETIDPPINGHVVKAEAGMVRSHKSSSDASAPQYNFSKTSKTPTCIVQPIVPPNASLNEKKMLQLEPTVAVAAIKSENVAEENVITPKNTEILAALFSPPTKTAEATNELKASPQSFPKDIVTCVEPEEEAKAFHEASSAAVVAHVEVDELVCLEEASLMQSTSSPVPSNNSEGALVKTQEPPVDTALNLSHTTYSEPHFLSALTKEEEEEENAMVREKNEINLAHMALAKLVHTEVREEKHEAKTVEVKETEQKQEVKIVEEKKTEQEVKTIEEKKGEEKQEAIIIEKREAEENEVDKDCPAMKVASGTTPNPADEGEVEYFSILDNKGSTKTYWESRMLATMDDGGWESVANVRFQPLPGATPVIVQTEDDLHTATPSPEFLPAPPPQFDNSPVESEESSPPSLDVPANQPTTAHNIINTTHNIISNNTSNITTTCNINLQETRPAKQYVYGISDASLPKEMRSARVVETVAKKPPASQENVIEAEIRAQQVKEVEMMHEGTLKSTSMVVREKGASSPASHDSDEGFVERLAEDAPAAPDGGFTHAIPGTDGEAVIYDAVSPPHQYFSESTPTPIPSSTETKIALEIRELKEREEELRQMRERLMNSRENLLDDEEARSSASREQLLEDHLTSLTTTTDEGNFSECGDPASSEDKSSDGSNSRIMSPDLHHPGTNLDYTRRKVTVKPFEDEEEDQPVYTRMQKESVIEREIRLAREREEAFRREKGISNSSLNSSSSSRASGQPPSTRAPPVVNNDGRDVQHRLATNRIQLEIQETSIKEKELRDAGKILTMSEDTVDAKVTRMSDFTDQNESPRIRPASSRPCNFSTPSPTPKCSSSPLSPSSPVPNFTPSPALSRGLSRSLSTTNLTSTSSLANSRAPKGLMQKFIASRGKMTGSAFASPPHTLAHTTSTSRGIPTRPMRVEPKATVIQRETLARMKPTPVDSSSNLDNTSQSQKQTSHVQQQYRRSYCTAEEKIQSELKEMQMREEELRQLRARQLAQSQPNLMDLGAEEDDHEDEESEHSFQEMNGLRTTYSNPNLLEDEPNQTQVMDKGLRRRSALIAQWENRIQQTTDT